MISSSEGSDSEGEKRLKIADGYDIFTLRHIHVISYVFIELRKVLRPQILVIDENNYAFIVGVSIDTFIVRRG